MFKFRSNSGQKCSPELEQKCCCGTGTGIPVDLCYSYNNIDWYPTSRSLCSKEIWDQLYDNLCKFNEIVPIMRCDCSNRPLSPPWNNTSLKRMRRNKDRALIPLEKAPLQKT